MKKVISIFVMVIAFTLTTNAQDKMMKTDKMAVKTVSLEQTKGVFTQQAVTLAEGSYIFEISNNNVGHDVGFVLISSFMAEYSTLSMLQSKLIVDKRRWRND